LVAVFPSRVAWKAFQKVHSGIFEFPSHKAQSQKENPHVVLGTDLVEFPLVFGACALGVFG
jgi:predicted RecA/RadA family phage recombinase